MLTRFKVSGFKSLRDVDVELAPLVVLFGPNAAGKSNFLDALGALSRLTTARTIAEALSGEDIRGYPNECFTLPPQGLPGLLEQPTASFRLTADLVTRGPGDEGQGDTPLRYAAEIGIEPRSGALSLNDEALCRLTRLGRPQKSTKPRLEKTPGGFVIRQQRGSGHPRTEPLLSPHTYLSDDRFSGPSYADYDLVRDHLRGWRTYYLDPRSEMRQDRPPQQVADIGSTGQHLGPFLHFLQTRHERHYAAIVRTVRELIPSIDDVHVRLDEQRGEIGIQVIQDGVPFSSRVISEGTLRVLALCAIALNPLAGSLVAYEEPENGVHPRRLEVVAALLARTVLKGARTRQLILTTHSPAFVGAMYALQRDHPLAVRLMVCRREGVNTRIEPFSPDGGLFQDVEVQTALSSPREDGMLSEALLRGWVDG